jgi:hypothetical protein
MMQILARALARARACACAHTPPATQVIDVATCKSRLSQLKRGQDFYFASLSRDLVLDAAPMGSVARFANHSCDPNSEVSSLPDQHMSGRKILRPRQEAADTSSNSKSHRLYAPQLRRILVGGEPHIVLFTLRDLGDNEAVCYNYHADTMKDLVKRQECR